MLNSVKLLGKITKEPKVIETKNGKQFISLEMSTRKPYKNHNGRYDRDFIDVVTWNTVSPFLLNDMKKNDTILIKGRVNTYTREENGVNIKKQNILATKISLVSKNQSRENEINNELNQDNIELDK